MKLKKIVMGTVMATTALLAVTGCGKQSSDSKDALKNIKEKGTLIVATSADYPPYEFQILENGKNKIVGMDVDLANAIGKELGVKVQIDNMQFDSVLAAVQNGKADIAMAGFTVTEERKKAVDFSDSYYEADQVALVNKKDIDKFKKASDFDDKQVLVQQGSIFSDIVKEQLPKAEIVTVDLIPNGVIQVQSSKVSAMVLDSIVAKSYVEKNSDLAIAPVKFKKTKEAANAIVFPKGNDALKKKINKIIKEQIANGNMEKYFKKNYDLQDKAVDDNK